MEASEGVPMKTLSKDESDKLNVQDSRGLVSEFNQIKLEKEARRNWDKFYKRNGDRFFKDRHWTTREFKELIDACDEPCLFEVGCGVGNFFYPLLEDGLKFKVYACDFSARAIEMVKRHSLYDPETVVAFECDITKDELIVGENCIDLLSLIFVLSAIHPCHFKTVIDKLFRTIRPGGYMLFRDYGLYDMTMIRFGPGSKLADRLYVRQDGTRSYFFNVEEISSLCVSSGFEVVACDFVYRKTINHKDGIDVQRIFVQGKFRKPV